MPGQWHNDMEDLFPADMKEIKFFCSGRKGKNNTCRRADILLNDKRTLEIQHSYISENEIIKRFNDWNKFGKEIIWFVDGNTDDIKCEKISSGNYLIIFNKSWKYKSFIKSYENILLDINKNIFKIELKKIKCKMICVSKPLSISDVIHNLKNNPENIWDKWDKWDDTNVIKPTLKIYQQGAGNGKTYGIWKNICENIDKEIYMIVTKQHSAKNVIYDELTDQTKREEFHIENLTEKNEHNTNKHYCIKYIHKKSKRECRVLIGTIDSFCYNLSGSDNLSQDFFMGILNNIHKNGLLKVSRYGNMNFAGQNFFINAKSEVWIDEVQDLPISYLYAFTRLILETNCDVHIVGDKLQSLEYPQNFLTEIINEKLPNINIVIETEKNDNRRIKVKGIHNKINEIINFKKYNLKEISCNESNLTEIKEDAFEIINSPVIYANDKEEDKIGKFIEILIDKVDKQVMLYFYTPNHFMFIFPIMKSNILAIELQTKLQEYWLEKFNDKNYVKNIKDDYWKKYNHSEYTQYVHLHKHTEGTVINTNDSIHSTRLMSIRTSKGDGRPVVFILGITESSLKILSNNEIDIVYESYLHVAPTRAKNKIYFGLVQNNDDIHRRFSKISKVEYLPPIKKNIQFEKLLEQSLDKKRLKNILLENNVSIKSYLEDHSNNKISIRKQVDWGYHCIKYASYLYKIIFNIIEKCKDNTNYKETQLFVVMQKISNLKITRKSSREFWDYLKKKQYKKGGMQMKEIPICVLNNQHNWKKYIEIIENSMKALQKKIKQNEISKLNVYQSIVLIFMIDIFQNQQYADKISPMELYNITHFFYDNPNNTKEKDLLEQIENINSMVSDTFINIGYNVKWNIFKRIQLKSEDKITVSKLQFPIVGFNKNKVIHIMLKSSLNNLNFWDIMVECLMERFLIYNPNGDKDIEKYKNKEVETIIFILDEGKHIKIKWTWDKDLYNNIIIELKKSIEKYYSNYNKDIYNYFLQIKSSDNNGKYWGKGTKFKTPFLYISKITEKKYPFYIYNLFKEFNDKWEKGEKEEIKKSYETFENFNEIINIKLNETLNTNFPKIIMDDVEDDF